MTPSHQSRQTQMREANNHHQKIKEENTMVPIKTDEEIRAMSREEKLQYAFDLLMMLPSDKIKELLAPYAAKQGVDL